MPGRSASSRALPVLPPALLRSGRSGSFPLPHWYIVLIVFAVVLSRVHRKLGGRPVGDSPGRSGGEPRHLEDLATRVEEFRSAVDHLVTPWWDASNARVTYPSSVSRSA
ncbi:hypothetical protein [Streptomyces sp. NPDC088246]|uniref:hypothetical protein n=1 Tax=Streptomyces sp. NPDC088246 TaxID=3365842 RepID=UPI003800E6E1